MHQVKMISLCTSVNWIRQPEIGSSTTLLSCLPPALLRKAKQGGCENHHRASPITPLADPADGGKAIFLDIILTQLSFFVIICPPFFR